MTSHPQSQRHEFSVTNSELLVDAPIVALRRDSVTMPGGGSAHREIVEHFGAVAVVAADNQNRIALVEQYRHSVGRRLWELPAGLLDVAGDSELTTAKRELVEEAGLKAQDWSLLLDLVTSPGFAEEAVRVFMATRLSEVERPPAEDEEADMGFTWMHIEDAREAVMSGRIVNSIAVAGILSAADVLSGQSKTRPIDTPFEVRPTHMAKRRQRQGVQPDMKKIGQ